MCYGRLPLGVLPKEGFPVGLIAAQSIGERGTQLSMQSFHTGQRAFSIADVRRILGEKNGKGYFKDLDGAKAFVKSMKECDAYKSLMDRHLHVLWRGVHGSPEGTLTSLIESHGPLTRIAFRDQARQLLLAVLKGAHGTAAEPSVRVMFDLFGERDGILAGDKA